MRLEVMRRTMQALADVDLSAAEKIMEIAEQMAATFPRKTKMDEIEAAKLQQSQNLIERNSFTSIGGDVSEMKMAPIAGALCAGMGSGQPCALYLN